MSLTIAQLQTAVFTAGSAYATASASYVASTPSTVLAYSSAVMAYSGALGQLARGLDPTTAALYEAQSAVTRRAQAFSDAQDAVHAANPYQVASLQNAADLAFAKLKEAQRQLALVNSASLAPVIAA